jgi:flagellin
MASVINTNIPSLNAQRNLSTSQAMMSQALQRLSSGLRVNSAKDDAAGLAIAERMNAGYRGFVVAQRNASDAISLAQTAEGGASKISDALQRMRELAVQSANGTNTTTDRDNLQLEYTQLSEEVTRLVDGTKFNDTALLNAATAFKFQIGYKTTGEDSITVTSVDLTTTVSAAVAAVSIDGADSTLAEAAIVALDTAIDQVTTARATWGASQNRFESVVSNLQISAENVAAARSRIVDADFATETANLTRASILQQAGTAMLAQANALPNTVLTLLRG